MESNEATVKVSLESVGLTLSALPPQFALAQGDAKNDVAQSLQNSFVFVSHSESEDSGSIVVLGNNSLGAIEKQSLEKLNEIRQKSLTIDCNSIISSLTPLEVEQKLTEVLQENYRLRAVLDNKNLSMKQVLQVITTKLAELNQSHEGHKRQFAETKALVNFLRSENNEYKKKMTELSKTCTDRSVQTEVENNETTVSMKSIEKYGECERPRVMEGRQMHDQETQTIQFESTDENCPASSTRGEFSGKSCDESVTENTIAKGTVDSLETLQSVAQKACFQLRNKLHLQKKHASKSQGNGLGSVFANYSSLLSEIEDFRKENESTSASGMEATSRRNCELDEVMCLSLRGLEALLEDVQNYRDQIVSGSGPEFVFKKEKEEIEEQRALLRIKEQKLVEGNAALHEEAIAIRDSNAALSEQLAVYQADWVAEREAREKTYERENELLMRIGELEDERLQLMTTLQYLQENPND